MPSTAKPTSVPAVNLKTIPANNGPIQSPTAAQAFVDSGASKVDCTTPFTIDDQGHKHYKASCL